MSCYYEIDGRVKTRACSEVEAIAEEFTQEYKGDFAACYNVEEDGSAEVAFNGGGSISHSGAEALDNIIKDVVPYLLEPALLHYEFESEEGWMYLGPPELEHPTRSAQRLAELIATVPSLTIEDRLKLADHLKNGVKKAA